MKTLALLLLLAAPPAAADYADPWGLPSGSATLALARIDSILAGAPVQGFDFTTGQVDSLSAYATQVAAGATDLIFVELAADESEHWLRGLEDPLYELDRDLIDDLGDLPLADVIAMAPLDSLERFVPALLDHAYGLLQIDAEAAPESTAVKLRVTALTDSTVSFDWVWQPNGEDSFQPSAVSARSLGAIKALY